MLSVVLGAVAIGSLLSVPLPWVIGGMGRYRDASWPAYRRAYHRLAASFGIVSVLAAVGAFITSATIGS